MKRLFMCVHKTDGPLAFWNDNRYCSGRKADFRGYKTSATLFTSLSAARAAIGDAFEWANAQEDTHYRAARRAWLETIQIVGVVQDAKYSDVDVTIS